MITTHRANEIIATSPTLGETCYESHKDFYGTRGRHMADWSQADLIRWWHSHFEFDEETQSWNNKIPFTGEK